jgi:hypothetical protein
MATNEEKEELVCPVCGRKDFKDKSGLTGHIRMKHPQYQGGTGPGTAVASTGKGKPSPVEALIQELKIPMLADGEAQVFDAGVEYGVRSVLVGVRVAQELSAMGVQQAMPLIKMAQEMRESEAQAAKILAGEFAEATLEANKDLKGAIMGLGNQITASGPNPFASMMAQGMSPVFSQAFQGLMKYFGGKSGEGAVPQPDVRAGQAATELPTPVQEPTVEYHKLEELEEEE